MKYRKAIVTAPRRFEIVEQELPALGGDQVLLKTISVGLCHTDMPVFLGTACESYSKSGIKRCGVDAPAYPAEVGHEPVAQVVEVGRNVKNFYVGEYVGGFGGGFSEYIVINDSTRTFCEIPESGKPVKFCVAEPLGCLVNIIKEASCRYGESIAVVGCGFMGLMIIAGLRRSGAKRLVALDLIDSKLELAKKYGATHTVNPKGLEIDEVAYEMTNGRFFDVVVEITGSLKGLDTACKIIKEPNEGGMDAFDGAYRGRGRVLIPSVYGAQETFPTSLAFNLMLRTPELIAVHPTYSPRPRENMQEGIASYIDGRLPADELVSHEFPLEDIQKGFEMLDMPDESFLKGIITF